MPFCLMLSISYYNFHCNRQKNHISARARSSPPPCNRPPEETKLIVSSTTAFLPKRKIAKRPRPNEDGEEPSQKTTSSSSSAPTPQIPKVPFIHIYIQASSSHVYNHQQVILSESDKEESEKEEEKYGQRTVVEFLSFITQQTIIMLS